jgi:C4-dicarboxylate transporter, DctM subunit
MNHTLSLNFSKPDAPGEPMLPRLFRLAENALAVSILLLIALLPVIDVCSRVFFSTGLYGSTEYLRHLTLWIAYAGALVTTREQRHLALSVGLDFLPKAAAAWIRLLGALLAVAVCTGLAISAYTLITAGFDPSTKVGLFSAQAIACAMPVGFGLIGLRFISAAPFGIAGKLVAVCGAAVALGAGHIPVVAMQWALWPFSLVLVAAALFGLPVFILLGGFTLLLFHGSGGSIAVITDQAYAMLTGPMIPTIPLFTLAGFVLSESKAGERLVRFFKAWFGWMPGGMAIMAITVSAFFTTFTGASGVTILALGGLLVAVLTKSGYRKSFGTGLLTSSGSIGLLFPPSLPIILYGVVAQINIKHLFVGGILPGILMIIVLSIFGINESIKNKVVRTPFNGREARASLIAALGEIALPVVILVCFFSGLTTLVESAAVAVVYALVLEVGIHRDISIPRVPGVILKCVPIIGGVLIILSAANGLSYFMVDAELPTQFAAWCSQHIHSRYLFLLLLNLSLLAVGCFADIFSAILIVVPLIVPLGAAFGINPVHLGIIFIANMELGYLTPLVGLNVFLASYRFEEPLTTICKNVIPFQISLFIAVLIITYLPIMTTGLLGIIQW